MKTRILPLLLAGSLAATGTASAQSGSPYDMGGSADPDTKRVRITYQNLTTTQIISPGVFFSHNASAPPLFELGKPAPFGLQRIAEEGNNGPLLSGKVTKEFGGAFGSAVSGISIQPGTSRTVELEVSRDHPLITGAMMLVMTNDGFTGISAVNGYQLERPVTMELLAYDAGTERNNEKRAFLVAMDGPNRDPENGVIKRHTGIRGNADAPAAWKFDTSRPVARVTITPVR